MAHYVCTGNCSFVSDKPDTCKNPECEQYNQPLTECHCVDGQGHEEIFVTNSEEED